MIEVALRGLNLLQLVFVPPCFGSHALRTLVVHQVLVGALNAIASSAHLALLAADADLNQLAQVELESGLIDGQSRLLHAWRKGAPDSP